MAYSCEEASPISNWSAYNMQFKADGDSGVIRDAMIDVAAPVVALMVSQLGADGIRSREELDRFLSLPLYEEVLSFLRGLCKPGDLEDSSVDAVRRLERLKYLGFQLSRRLSSRDGKGVKRATNLMRRVARIATENWREIEKLAEVARDRLIYTLEYAGDYRCLVSRSEIMWAAGAAYRPSK